MDNSVASPGSGEPVAHPLDLLLSLVVPLVVKAPNAVVAAPGHNLRVLASVFGLGLEDTAAVVSSSRLSRLFRGLIAGTLGECVHPFLYSLLLLLIQWGVMPRSASPTGTGFNLCSQAASHAFEVVATRQRAFDDDRNPGAVAWELYSKGGISRLFAGLVLRFVHSSAHSFLYRTVYRQLAIFTLSTLGLRSIRGGRLLCGVGAWFAASAVTYPVQRAWRLQAATGWSAPHSFAAMLRRDLPLQKGAVNEAESDHGSAAGVVAGERDVAAWWKYWAASCRRLWAAMKEGMWLELYDGFAVSAVVGVTDLSTRSLFVV